MKLMFYITSIERGGGAERVLCNLANRFSQLGHECIMVTSEDSDQRYELDSAVRYIPLAKTRLDGFLNRNRTLLKGLRSLVLENKPDVLLSFMAEPNFRAIPACRGTSTRTIISVRNDPDREYPTFVHRFLAKILFRHADFTVFQTKDAQAWFPKAVRRKSAVILNQVDYRFFENAYSGGERKDIVTTGRLVSQKNHSMLMKAFSLMADKCSDNLIIYGEGELRAELEAQVHELGLEKRVLLPGKTSNVVEAIRKARAYVLSSDYEGMPNALMEALVLGVPCISTDCPCGGPRELIEDGVNGLLTPVGDPEALSRKLLDLVNDKDLQDRLGENAIKASKAYYPDTVFDLWRRIVENQ